MGYHFQHGSSPYRKLGRILRPDLEIWPKGSSANVARSLSKFQLTLLMAHFCRTASVLTFWSEFRFALMQPYDKCANIANVPCSTFLLLNAHQWPVTFMRPPVSAEWTPAMYLVGARLVSTQWYVVWETSSWTTLDRVGWQKCEPEKVRRRVLPLISSTIFRISSSCRNRESSQVRSDVLHLLHRRGRLLVAGACELRAVALRQCSISGRREIWAWKWRMYANAKACELRAVVARGLFFWWMVALITVGGCLGRFSVLPPSCPSDVCEHVGCV
jgi:hypothetical protein